MLGRHFIVLGVCAFCALIAAGITVGLNPSYKEAIPDGKLLFPDLINKAKEVKVIKLHQAGHTMTFKNVADNWGLDESDNYPVQQYKIAQVIFGVSQLKLLEAKTDKKDQWGKLHLEDPNLPNAKSQRLTLLDAEANIIADLIVGRGNFSLPQTAGAGGIYIRQPQDEQTWLALGHLDLGVEPRDWLERRIVNITEDQVDLVTVVHPDGDIIRIRSEGDDFKLLNIPEGKALTDKNIPRSYVSGVASLLLNDVKHAGKILINDKDKIRVDFKLKDGLALKFELWQENEMRWVAVEAIGGENALKVNSRIKGWAYNIPEYYYELLAKKKQQLLKSIGKKP